MTLRKTVYGCAVAGAWALGTAPGCMMDGASVGGGPWTSSPLTSDEAAAPVGSVDAVAVVDETASLPIDFDAALGPACPQPDPEDAAPTDESVPGDAAGSDSGLALDAASDPTSEAGQALDPIEAGPAAILDGASDDAADVRPRAQCQRSLGRAGICVPQVAAGWEGPGALLMSDSPDHLPLCPEGAPTEFATGTVLGAQPSTCNGCTCGEAEGLVCTAGSPGILYWDSTCSYPGCPPGGSGDDCIGLRAPCSLHGSSPSHLAITPGQLSGTCAPSAPPSAPSIVHASAARACKANQGVVGGPPCLQGATCIDAGYKTCIFKNGADLACPGSVYTERAVFYRGVEDSRACTSCACGVPQGATCASRMELRDGNPNTCTAPLVDTVETESICVDLRPLRNSTASIRFVPGEPLGHAACAASGTSTGTLVPKDPFTACCIP